MTTWLRVWPLCVVPGVVLMLLGCLPQIAWVDKSVGGASVRAATVEVALVSWLPSAPREEFQRWYAAAPPATHYAVHAWLALNLNTLLLPLTYGLARACIASSAWSMRTEWELKRGALRRSTRER